MEEKLRKFSKRDVFLIVLALIVIAWAAYFYMNNRGFLGGDRHEVSKVEGKFIAGFPKEFVFENGVTLRDSVRTESNSENLWTASYISSKTSAEIFSIYKNALEFLGWEISNSTLNKTIFAKKGNMQISVSMEDRTNRREVVLSILER